MTRKSMVLLTAAIFQGPLADETQEVPWGNSFCIVGKDSLGSNSFQRLSSLQKSGWSVKVLPQLGGREEKAVCSRQVAAIPPKL